MWPVTETVLIRQGSLHLRAARPATMAKLALRKQRNFPGRGSAKEGAVDSFSTRAPNRNANVEREKKAH